MTAGFTLVETLIALVLTLIVSGSALSLLSPASRVSATQPEMADVQQRARVAVETLTRELASAGAGVSLTAGPLQGVLPLSVPALLPRRLGSVRGEGPDTARPTAVTMFAVPQGAAETTTASAISADALTLTTTATPQCGGATLCGFQAGQDVLVSDGTGHFDVFRLVRLTGAAATLRLHGQDLTGSYAAGSTVTTIVQRTFEFDAATGQLRVSDGDQSDQPAVDHVSALEFHYFVVADAGGLAEVPLTTFTDGPWIGAGTTRFDADLLRVRAIRVRVTAEAADPALRGVVAPFSLLADIAPRALSVGR